MQLIQFDNAIECTCQKRPSRIIKSPYVADLTVDGNDVLGHCPSLGLGNIIHEGCRMLCTKNTNCKTDYTVQAVMENDIWVGNVPLHANRIVHKLLTGGCLLDKVQHVKPEVKMGDSRFDFLVTLEDSSEIVIEVKSVHIKINNTAIFPVGGNRKVHTISERANKHLTHLKELSNSHKKAMIIFVIQRGDCDNFSPNWKTDPIFSNKLYEAYSARVAIKCVYTDVNCNGIYLRHVADYFPTLQYEDF